MFSNILYHLQFAGFILSEGKYNEDRSFLNWPISGNFHVSLCIFDIFNQTKRAIGQIKETFKALAVELLP